MHSLQEIEMNAGLGSCEMNISCFSFLQTAEEYKVKFDKLIALSRQESPERKATIANRIMEKKKSRLEEETERTWVLQQM